MPSPCLNNVEQWAHPLHDLTAQILQAPSDAPTTADLVSKAATLADEMMNGVDLNGNGIIEPTAGECGAQIAFEEVYSMADMAIYPYMAPPSSTSVPKQNNGSNSNNGGGGGEAAVEEAAGVAVVVEAAEAERSALPVRLKRVRASPEPLTFAI